MKDMIVVELKVQDLAHYTHQEAADKLHIIKYFLRSEHREEIIEKYYKYIYFLEARLKQPDQFKKLLEHLETANSLTNTE